MREIKFRAWDNVKNRMYYAGEEDYIYFSLTSGGILAEDVSECGFPEDETEVMEHLKYLQYTGLKDVNGKEIYEGDIVLYDRNVASEIDRYKYIVKWEHDRYILDHNFSEITDGISWELLEVIGNIYESEDNQ